MNINDLGADNLLFTKVLHYGALNTTVPQYLGQDRNIQECQGGMLESPQREDSNKSPQHSFLVELAKRLLPLVMLERKCTL